MQAQVTDIFLSKFQLKQEEVQILRGTRDGSLHPVCINFKIHNIFAFLYVYPYYIRVSSKHLPESSRSTQIAKFF
jgi:hypothetical protein